MNTKWALTDSADTSGDTQLVALHVSDS